MIEPLLVNKLRGNEETLDSLWFRHEGVIDDAFWGWMKAWFDKTFTDHTPNIADVRITEVKK